MRTWATNVGEPNLDESAQGKTEPAIPNAPPGESCILQEVLAMFWCSRAFDRPRILIAIEIRGDSSG